MDFTTKTLKRPARIAALGFLSLFLAAPAALAERIIIANPFDLSGLSSAPGSRSPIQADLSAAGEYADFTATPANGYVFRHWQFISSVEVYGAKTNANPVRLYYNDSITLLQLRPCFAPTYDVALNPCGGNWKEDATSRVRVVYGDPYGELDSPMREGYGFDGWFTETSGGEKVTEATIVSKATEHTLYAQWSGIESTLTFDPRGGAFADPSEATRTVTYGSPYGKLPNVSNPGYSLEGWFSAASGGEPRTESNTVMAVANHTLYAHWEPIIYAVAFNGNGATSGSTARQGNRVYGEAFTLSPNGFVRYGSKFLGWNTKADGSGSSYTNCAEVINLTTTPNDVVILYAQWSAAVYHVHFEPNGGDGSMDDQTIQWDVDTALASNAFDRVGYAFVSWRDDANNTNHLDGATARNLFADGTTGELVATWAPVDYTVSFKRGAAVAKGEMDELPCVYDSPTTLPPCTITNPLGAFLGWALDPKATKPDFLDKAVVTNLATTAGAVVPLYAIWDSELTDLSRAIGCDTLKLNSTGDNRWTVYTNDVGEVCLRSGSAASNSFLTTATSGPGTLSFEWCVSGPSPADHKQTATYKGVDIGKSSSPVASDSTAANIATNVWYEKIFSVPAGDISISWYSKFDYVLIRDGEWAEKSRLFLRNVTWLPDADPNLVYTVRFDPGKGSGTMADQTCQRGVPSTLPSNSFTCADLSFDHWHDSLNGCDYPDGATVVDLAPGCGTNTLVAVWSLPPSLTVDAKDWSGPYDGNGHGISVTVAEPGAAVGYATSAAGPFLPDNPLYTDATNAPVWFVASLAGYSSTTGCASVMISQAANTWTVAPSIAGWNEGEAPSPPVAKAAFGEFAVTYSSGGATPPTAPGDYYAIFAVAATENWTGLSTNVAFTVAKYISPPPPPTILPPTPPTIPPPPPPTIPPLRPNDGPYDGSAARVYDGWALSPESNLVAVIQLKAAKLRTRKGVASFTATATVKDEAAKSWRYSKGVGTADGDVSGLVCTARNVPVPSFGATLGADNLAGSWGGYEIFGARAGMGVKGDKMADALEAYRGSWTLTLTNATGTTRLQLVVGARGSTKISGNVTDVSVPGGYKVVATVQSVMGKDGLYVPYLAVLKQRAFSLNASLLAKLTLPGAVEVICSGFGPLAAGGRTTEDLGVIAYPEDDPPHAGEVFSAFVSVNDLAYPVKFSARGLPAGLKLNASSGEISGIPTKPGVYHVVVTARSGVNSKIKVVRTLTITVDNFRDDAIPVQTEEPYGPARVGVKFRLHLPAAEGCSARGLPAGLKFATKPTQDSVFGSLPAWTIYGVPTKAGTNTVVFKKSVKETIAGRTVTVTHVAHSTLPVEGLDVWARGNFAGAAFANHVDVDPNGLLPSLSVSAAGKLSGKFIDADGATWTLSAPAYDEFDPAASSYSASVLCKNGKLVATNTIKLRAQVLDGVEYGFVSGDDPLWTARQSPWANEPWKSMAKQFARQQLGPIPDGAGGTITLKLTATGAVSAKLATTATNPRTGATIAYTATCSSTLVPLGGDEYKVFVHFPPKATATVDFPGCSLAIPLKL